MLPRVRWSGSLLLVALSIAAAGCKKESAKADPAAAATSSGVRVRPADGELASLLTREAANAEAHHLRPFAELRADWCGPCKKLEAAHSDPLMTDAFAGTYIIQVDVDDWANKMGAAGLASEAIPVFFALDAHGKPTGRKIDGGAWGKDTPENMAPPLKAFFRTGS